MPQRSADNLVFSLMMDTWPNNAATVDFGLDGYGGGDPQRRYNALHYAVREGGVNADQLHETVLNGGLTELIRENNPDKEVEFKTVNDFLNDFDEEDEED